MNITRRIVFSAGLASMFAIAACTTQQANTIGQQVVTDVNILSNGLTPILPQLAPSVPPDAQARIAVLVAQVQAAVNAIVPGMTAALAQPTVVTIGNAVNAIAAELQTVPGIPTNVRNTVTAAQALLPLIEVAVNMVIPVGASPSGMSPAQARMILRASR